MQFSELVKKSFVNELELLLSASGNLPKVSSKPDLRALSHVEVILERLLACLLFQVSNLQELAPSFPAKVALLKSINPRWALLNTATMEFLEGVALYAQGNRSSLARNPSAKEMKIFCEELAVQVSLRLALERATAETNSYESEGVLQQVGADLDAALADLRSILLKRG